MDEDYTKVKERLIQILNSQKTINYFKEHFSKIPISCSPLILNLIIEDIFIKEKDVILINYKKQKSKINNILIFNKKFLIRLHSFHSQTKKLTFKSYYNLNFMDEDILEYVIEDVNEEIDSYDYIFLIREEYEEAHLNKERKFKSVYHYYLIPIEIYKINEKEKEEKIKEHKKRLEKYGETIKINTFYGGALWVFFYFSKFFFKYSISLLDEYNIGYPYINC